MPKWIDRQAAKAAPALPRAFDAALMTRLEMDADRRRLAQAPRPPAKPYLQRQPMDFPPAAKCSVEGELRRLKQAEAVAKRPINWFSSRREELVRDGLVEVVLHEDGKWAGDRITAAGRARIK